MRGAAWSETDPALVDVGDRFERILLSGVSFHTQTFARDVRVDSLAVPDNVTEPPDNVAMRHLCHPAEVWL